KVNQDLTKVFDDIDGIIVPGGFGQRGIEGMIRTIKYARENKVPFFGIGIGMQCAVVEFAQNICGLEDAHTTEVKPDTPHPVIDFPLKGHCEDVTAMRLGSFTCKLSENTRAKAAYGKELVKERHRHRYEFNNDYMKTLAQCGMVFSGVCPDNNFIEIIELKDHPWFLATVFHPEFKSRPNKPHPLFSHFIKAALKNHS
ncbi:MAG: CTP synthase, partial [Thermoanaerobacteraceae bacterium]|nr:CTP synthase [Thermoanaerobacteraceae bacterium]